MFAIFAIQKGYLADMEEKVISTQNLKFLKGNIQPNFRRQH